MEQPITTKNVGQPCVICGQAADAQATIAALQARVRELEQWVQDQSTANLETMRHTDEMQSRAMEAEQQLTQRTAERDTARRRVDELEAREVDVVLLREDLERRTAELERVTGELVDTSLYLQQERANRDSLAACVGRDVKTIKELRGLILALPKVEGEITANRVCTIMMRGLYCEEFTKLLQHRQGME